ncbi:hypothetical protein DSECCO2_388210 [anaerobic digester metagenome]
MHPGYGLVVRCENSRRIGRRVHRVQAGPDLLPMRHHPGEHGTFGMHAVFEQQVGDAVRPQTEAGAGNPEVPVLCAPRQAGVIPTRQNPQFPAIQGRIREGVARQQFLPGIVRGPPRPGRGPELLHVGEDKVDFRSSQDDVGGLSQKTGRKTVVTVQRQNPVPRGGADADITGVGQSPVFLAYELDS